MRAQSFAAAVLLLTVAGCAGNQGTQPQTGDTRFVAGDGKITLFEAADRKAAPAVEGETLDGGSVNLATHKGKVVVLNFWASWCAPCRAEAPVLKDIAAKTKATGVEFLGIDFKDRKADALAFERSQQSGYPSIFDQPGKVALSFQGTVPPAAIPSTLIIDRQGRIAARALGAVKYNDLLSAVTKIGDEK
ncbi:MULTISPECIES: TlpA family protein disulfide reductase [Streptosporangium]|uniref:Thiol-disulfide isomerase/thioredoxin n=1 Tax=Streptosporangium brasiliense TaxID=47480 RepID=A0ABT9R2R0_9ACTN|nr:TlpA disulfide reductase family protein [Streptosporangium brasiliense]MDP9863508.1 thiol-disulfide isomerase/thioredoxin [Streptosporangium brasiliense]